MVPSLKRLVHDLYDIGAFKVDTKKGFRLALHDKNPDAPLSPFYLNLRTGDNPKPGPLTPDLVRRISYEIGRAVKGWDISYSGICGIPNAGVPFSTALLQYWHSVGNPKIRVNLSKCDTSAGRAFTTTNMIHSGFSVGSVLLVDDLITSETVKRLAINTLRIEGYPICAVAVFLDRRPNPSAYLSDGTRVAAALTIADMLLELERTERISNHDATAIWKYLQS